MILEDLFRNPLHLITLLVIVVLLMGGGRLKDTMGSLGTGIREFKKNIRDDEPANPSAFPAAPAPGAFAASLGDSAVTTAASLPMHERNGTSAESSAVVQAVRCQNCLHLNAIGSRHCNECGVAIA